MKIVTIKGLWLLYGCTKFYIDISNRLWVIGVWNVENHTHTHISGRQLKITFLDILHYSEYSDTNISIFFFSRKQLPQWGSKIDIFLQYMKNLRKFVCRYGALLELTSISLSQKFCVKLSRWIVRKSQAGVLKAV